MAPAKTSSSEGKEASEKQNSAPDPMKDVSWPGVSLIYLLGSVCPTIEGIEVLTIDYKLSPDLLPT